MNGGSRQRVLAVYRQILRLASKWTALNPAETEVERRYIVDEAKSLFRRNKNISDRQEINQRIMEAEARIEMAMHYKNPYPRMSNVPPFSVSKGKGRQASDDKRIRTTPVHLTSYKDSPA